MVTQQEKLKELLHKSLKSFGYIKSEYVKNSDKIYYQLYLKDDKRSVLVFVANSHNCYFVKELKMFREVCTNLISCGYNISMNYPCYIVVNYRYFDDIYGEEESYFYSE